MNNQPISLTYGLTLKISATTTTANGQWTGASAEGAKLQCVRLYNAGPNTAFIRRGSGGGLTAVVDTDFPLPAGAIEIVSKGNDDTIAAICASGTATVYATPTEGQ